MNGKGKYSFLLMSIEYQVAGQLRDRCFSADWMSTITEALQCETVSGTMQKPARLLTFLESFFHYFGP